MRLKKLTSFALTIAMLLSCMITTSAAPTWTGRFSDATGMELCVDNAYSGDKVCVHGIARALQLHNNEGENPDVIAVFLGVNDLIGGCTVSTFSTNYNTMIQGMRAKYPDAEIYLMSFPFYPSADITGYCDVIEQTAQTYNCTFVDLYRDCGINASNVENHMVDGFLHPNYLGMDKISECLVNAMLAELKKNIKKSFATAKLFFTPLPNRPFHLPQNLC